MSRFFLTSEDTLQGGEAWLGGENYHHLTRSLRVRVGESVTVCDGRGTDYIGTVSEVSSDKVTVKIDTVTPSAGEYGPQITLFQCLAKGDKMADIVTRAVEMGVSRIVPVVSRFCVAKNENEDKKRERMQRIALSAAKQSGRGVIPEIGPTLSLTEAIGEMCRSEVAFFCYECEKTRALSDLPMAESYAFLIGPEGGIATEEAAALQAAGIVPISLGHRILRTENAAMYVLPILQYINEKGSAVCPDKK